MNLKLEMIIKNYLIITSNEQIVKIKKIIDSKNKLIVTNN